MAAAKQTGPKDTAVAAVPPIVDSTPDAPTADQVKASLDLAKLGDDDKSVAVKVDKDPTGPWSSEPKREQSWNEGYLDEVQRRPKGVDAELRLQVATSIFSALRSSRHGALTTDLITEAVKDADALIAAVGIGTGISRYL